MPGRLDGKQHPVERQRFVQNIGVRLECRVDRNEIIGAIKFDAVPGIIYNGDVRIPAQVAEVAQGLAQFANGQVEFGLDRVKTC